VFPHTYTVVFRVYQIILSFKTVLNEPTMINRSSLEETPSLLTRIYTGCSSPQGGGILGSQGNLWKENRKFTVRAIKSLELQKEIFEELILLEWTYVDKELR